jgi:type II secretory pathway pseudopilin PulG
LVVVTIIGILASLITVAAVRAMSTARQAAIKVELNEISAGFERYKDKANSYPPNTVTDDNDFNPTPEPPDTPINEAQVLNDLRRHFRQAFPQHNEPPELIDALAGAGSGPSLALAGGMTQAEAVVFWLGGFSPNPKYPISGEGGPAFPIPGIGDPSNRTRDPIESRNWVFPFKVDQLGPRGDDRYFPDPSEPPPIGLYGQRFIEYQVTINGTLQYRRINFWQYVPGRSQVPVVYFDVSRHPAAVRDGSGKVVGPFDPPAASDLLGDLALHVHAMKMRSESASATVRIRFANEGKFQVLHCGIDDAWGDDILDRTSAHGVAEPPPDGPGLDPADPNSYLLYPDGPFTGDAADTVVNFIVQSRLEDAQPQ